MIVFTHRELIFWTLTTVLLSFLVGIHMEDRLIKSQIDRTNREVSLVFLNEDMFECRLPIHDVSPVSWP